MNERIQLHWFLGEGRAVRPAAHDRQRPRAGHCAVVLSSPQRAPEQGETASSGCGDEVELRGPEAARVFPSRFSVPDTPVERTPRLPTIAVVFPALLLPRR